SRLARQCAICGPNLAVDAREPSPVEVVARARDCDSAVRTAAAFFALSLSNYFDVKYVVVRRADARQLSGAIELGVIACSSAASQREHDGVFRFTADLRHRAGPGSVNTGSGSRGRGGYTLLPRWRRGLLGSAKSWLLSRGWLRPSGEDRGGQDRYQAEPISQSLEHGTEPPWRLIALKCGRVPPERRLGAVAQFERCDADRQIEPGLTLQAQRLQRNRAVRSADQHIGIAAGTDRGARGDPTVIPGEVARTNIARRREHRPTQHRSLGHAQVEADFPHDAMVGHGGRSAGVENAGKFVNRADHETDRARPTTFQYTDLDTGLPGG